jgi:membrane fusion protein (multidrug efflux system)
VLQEVESGRREVDVRRTDLDVARGRAQQAAASLREAEMLLEFTTIRAPRRGRITKKNVEVGQFVQPGQALIAVVGMDDVWVTANFKENQISQMRPGQRVSVVLDAYPGATLRAHVDSIQAGTGSRFALLPPENASGNFVKVVQRVPVKLVFEPGEIDRRPLPPGLSVVPTVELR